MIFLLVYVDDILLVTFNTKQAEEIENDLQEDFTLTILGPVDSFLGLKCQRLDDGSFSLSQSYYIQKLLRIFGLENAKPSKAPIDTAYFNEPDKTPVLPSNETYRSLLGALLYISVHTRPDIAAATSILCRKISSPSERDFMEAKRVLRYLKTTQDLQLVLGRKHDNIPNELAYVDADWAGDRTDCKSNSGMLLFYQGSAIDWFCRKQISVSLSSTEAEYIALSEACKQILPVNRLMKEIRIGGLGPVTIREDNQGAIKLVENGKVGRRSKHIDTRFHFVRELHEQGTITLEYCPTENMIADILKKPLGAVKMANFRQLMGLLPGRSSDQGGVLNQI